MTARPVGAVRAVFLLVAGIALGACSSSTSDGKGGAKDGGAGAAHTGGGTGSSTGGTSGSSGGVSGSSGGAQSGTGGLAIGMVLCGDAVCSPLKDPSTESFACCSDLGGCGLRLPISSKCFSKNQPGHTNPVCKPYEIQGKVQYTGCCSPTGCGALVTTAGIGCVPNPDLNLPAVSCVFEVGGTGGGGGADAAATSGDASAP